jgi:molybdenum cofactor cytidylyltransferase
MIAAVVPAAGRSERMGRPKLILPLGGETVIARLIRALREGGAETIVVVAPPADIAGADALAIEASRAGAVVVVAGSATADMRASVELGLDWLVRGPAPECILIAPGDSPGITAELVRRVVDRASAEPGAIVVPRFGGRGGHPVALPWHLAAEVRDLPEGTGVNALLAARADRVLMLDVDEPGTTADLDTPDDYRAWVEAGRDGHGRPNR